MGEETRKEQEITGEQYAYKGVRARSGVAIVFFAVMIVGEIFLLRNVLFTYLFSEPKLTFWIEVIFWILHIIGIVVCVKRKEGWGGWKGRTIVFVLFGLFLLHSIMNYSVFLAAYMTGFQFTYESTAGGMVGIKLFLSLIGITAGIPVAAPIDSREYARRLREKTLQQEVDWAKEAVKGARKDLKQKVEQLRASLTDEELKELIRELEADGLSEKAPDPAEKSGGETNGQKTRDEEDWKGWGNGI